MHRRESIKQIALNGALLWATNHAFADLYTFGKGSTLLNKNGTTLARLLFNENPFGPSEAVKQVITDSLLEVGRYAVDDYRMLAEKIAKEEGIKPENILIGAGSTEFLLLCGLYYGLKKGRIITPSPSYSTLTEYIKNFESLVDYVPLDKNYTIDVAALSKAIKPDTSLIYICNPNNPTGTVVDYAKLRSFCEFASHKQTVLVDEAYIEFLDDYKSISMVSQVKKGNNVIVLRTFSKLYGLAGLRIGYLMANESIVSELKKFYSNLSSVALPSLKAALAAYDDKNFLQNSRLKLQSSKNFTESILTKNGYNFIPSQTNYILFELKMDGEKFKAEMLKRGVSIKVWNFDQKHWCRVSLGTADEMNHFAHALKQIG